MKLSELRSKMNKSIDYFREQVKGLRYGTVTPSLVDTVKVPSHGQMMPLKHLAASSKIKSGISIEPYEPGLVGPVSNALKKAGFNAYVFSKTTVMVSVPPPCGVEKDRIRKRIKVLGDEAKVSVRNLRKKAKKEIEQENYSIKALQSVTDEMTAEIDEIVKSKVESI
jgi:ribosome recycling factor